MATNTFSTSLCRTSSGSAPRSASKSRPSRRRCKKPTATRCCNRMQADGFVTIDLPDGPLRLDSDDIEVRLQAREGWAAAQGPSCVVVLNTEVTDELRREGIAKDLIRTIQNQRKEIGCEYTDRIEVGVESDDDNAVTAINEHRAMICSETLAVSLELGRTRAELNRSRPNMGRSTCGK